MNRELFHDVEAINVHLDESKATVDLFKKLDLAESNFAASIYDLAEESLVAAKEYALARKHLGDPFARLAAAQHNLESGIPFADEVRGSGVTRRAFETIYTDEVLRLITVLDQTGDRSLAKEIQSKALSVLDSPAIRNAVSN